MYLSTIKDSEQNWGLQEMHKNSEHQHNQAGVVGNEKIEKEERAVHGDCVAMVVEVDAFEQIILGVAATAAVLRELVEVEGVVRHLRELAIANKLQAQSLVQRLQKPVPVVGALDVSPSMRYVIDPVGTLERSIVGALESERSRSGRRYYCSN